MVRKRTHSASVDVSLRLLDRDAAFALRELPPRTRRVDMLIPPRGHAIV